ncbi:MAG: Gfo/Idh/MocA family oxidoreductase [Synechococcaceae cyanobacterium]|nr:Gfo/Idh/MocA family oxidoreductase [Synechococcaceae cyanobacterium]
MSAPPLRVAIAGLGFGEKVHLTALRDCPATEPVALWHPRAERLEQACQRHGLPGSTSFEALLADPQIDALVIATPPEPRPALARAALEAGKALLLEKPVAPETAAIEELQRLALRRGLTVAVDFEYRAVPLFQQLATLLEQGVLGTPWLVKFDWLMASRADANRPWSWYSSAAAGGGVLGALGTHAFDILHWLIGPAHDVRGRLSTAIRERPLPDGSALAPVDADDVALLHLELEDRAGRRIPCQVSLASVARNGRGCWLELVGSDATLVLGSDNQSDYVHGFQLWMARPGEPLRPLPLDPALAYARTWEDGRIAPVRRLIGWWAEAVREGRPMVPGLAEAVASQHCCDQARRQV